jgi:hypothetical protein
MILPERSASSPVGLRPVESLRGGASSGSSLPGPGLESIGRQPASEQPSTATVGGPGSRVGNVVPWQRSPLRGDAVSRVNWVRPAPGTCRDYSLRRARPLSAAISYRSRMPGKSKTIDTTDRFPAILPSLPDWHGFRQFGEAWGLCRPRNQAGRCWR